MKVVYLRHLVGFFRGYVDCTESELLCSYVYILLLRLQFPEIKYCVLTSISCREGVACVQYSIAIQCFAFFSGNVEGACF